MKKLLLISPFAIITGALLLFSACKKTDDPSSANNTPVDKIVTAGLQGRVLDEKGVPVDGATVTSGTASTTTDVNGVFTFGNISLSSRWGYVKVTKTGYFTGSRTIFTIPGSGNFVRIDLLPRVEKGSFDAASGGNIVVQGGNSVSFDGAVVVNASSNAAYTGTVHVFAAWLDPTDAGLPHIMPGALRGVTTTGQEKGLQSYGMMIVELQGDAGEKLQIAPGKKAKLTMALPASLQAAAPDSIPMWYFSDSTGKWMEQGSAVKQGGSYIGQVGHFSYWNYDAIYNTVNFKVHVKDSSGNAVAYTYIQFTSPAYGFAGGYTDSGGYAQGVIPQGQMLIFQIFNPCGTPLFGENVGPTLGDQDMGTIVLDLGPDILTFIGSVVDCNSDPVANGYVIAKLDGLYYGAAVANGTYKLNVLRCDHLPSQALVTAGEFATGGQGTAIPGADTLAFRVTGGIAPVGQLSVCR